MSINQRLKAVRKELKLTQEEFCEPLNMKRNSYSDLERGEKRMSASFLQNLASVYNINPSYIVLGRGSMWIDEGGTNTLPNEVELLHKLVQSKDKMISMLEEKIGRLEGE